MIAEPAMAAAARMMMASAMSPIVLLLIQITPDDRRSRVGGRGLLLQVPGTTVNSGNRIPTSGYADHT
jgi:hypothetical protein